jgi:hypothetical protein
MSTRETQVSLRDFSISARETPVSLPSCPKSDTLTLVLRSEHHVVPNEPDQYLTFMSMKLSPQCFIAPETEWTSVFNSNEFPDVQLMNCRNLETIITLSCDAWKEVFPKNLWNNFFHDKAVPSKFKVWFQIVGNQLIANRFDGPQPRITRLTFREGLAPMALFKWRAQVNSPYDFIAAPLVLELIRHVLRCYPLPNAVPIREIPKDQYSNSLLMRLKKAASGDDSLFDEEAPSSLFTKLQYPSPVPLTSEARSTYRLLTRKPIDFRPQVVPSC